MDKSLETALQSLSKSVEGTTISPDGKRTIAWCLGKLGGLYNHYLNTRESRYGDEITRLVQAVIKELAAVPDACPEASRIAAGMADRFALLHERLGLPTLILKCPTPAKVAAPRKRVAKPRV